MVNLLLCLAVFAGAFLYRFNTLGGALGGFSNDEFGYLARARQILGGEVPFRDFNDPGWFLTDYLSAAGQWLGGYNLRSEALLTVGLLSLGAALTFLLARRASGSILAAMAGVAFQLAVEPRHYNYPKILLYAVGLALAWAYVDRPGRGRLAALGALIGVGFLFRHDHLLYLGVLAALTIAFVHRNSMRDFVRAAAVLGVVVVGCIVPFLVFLTVNGGIGDYFRSAFVYVARDAQRTSFSFPRFSIDASKPFVTLSGTAPSGDARINVRWAPVSDEQRRERESRYRLADGAERDGTWSYRLQDVSPGNIEALVRDPLVDDTHGLDRARFTVQDQPRGFESQLDSVPNATAYLYYFLLAVPVAAAAALLRIRSAAVPARLMTSAPYMVPLLAVAALLNAGFLSRGSTNIRIADVSVTGAVLIAWLIAAVAGRDARIVWPRIGARAAARVTGGVALMLAMLSANGIGQWWRHLDDSSLLAGPAEVLTKSRQAWRALGAPTDAFNADEEQPRVLRLAAYVKACTAPTDRLFVLGAYPELYYFSERLFAGGHAWLLPLYYSDEPDETRIVERIRSARVPIVLTEAAADYEENYRPVFDRVHDYLEAEYTEAGEVDYGGPQPLRVLVRTDLPARGRYEPLGLPCFTSPLGVEDNRPANRLPLALAGKSPLVPVDGPSPSFDRDAPHRDGFPQAVGGDRFD